MAEFEFAPRGVNFDKPGEHQVDESAEALLKDSKPVAGGLILHYHEDCNSAGASGHSRSALVTNTYSKMGFTETMKELSAGDMIDIVNDDSKLLDLERKIYNNVAKNIRQTCISADGVELRSLKF